MDNAVALVQAYLRVNGYFTITEVPMIEVLRTQNRAVTDLDVLAFRLADEHAKAGTRRIVSDRSVRPDPVLACDRGRNEMLIGEIKEGRASLNKGARNPSVLAAAMRRFGCCSPEEADSASRELRRRGEVQVAAGHRVRLFAFGSQVEQRSQGHRQIALGHITSFLRSLLRERWSELQHAQIKDPALGFLLTLEKARRGRKR